VERDPIGAAGACGKVCAIRKTRGGDRLLEIRRSLPADPIDGIDWRALYPAASPFIAIAGIAATARWSANG